MKLRQTCKAIAGSFLAAILTACGGGGGGDSQLPPSEGTLGVFITDSPACGFNSVFVTVAKVRVHQSATAADTDAGWSELVLNPARKIDLLSLTNGVLLSLGQVPLPAGHYTQLRLVLSANAGPTLANSVVPAGGVETALDTPSAIQSGVKLINQFDVAANTRVDLALDFDACRSIVTKGNGGYALKPVIRVVPMIVSGKIAGFVDPTLAASHAGVAAEQGGVMVQKTIPDATGAFTLSPLVQSSTAGNYDIVVNADGHATAVIASVPVTANTTTNVSASGSPITLPASPTHNVSGTAALNPLNDGVTAFVAAKQTFGTVPIVTVGVVGADASTGAYRLTLPVVAPLLGQFGSGVLPVAFSAQTSLAGNFAIEASATGYKIQSVNVNVTSADVVQNFLLSP